MESSSARQPAICLYLCRMHEGLPQQVMHRADVVNVAYFNQVNIYCFSCFVFQIQDYEESKYRWFCGQFSNPSALSSQSSSNRIRLTFRSDRFGSGRGFELSYNFIPKD